MNIIILSIPLFFVLIGLEVAYSYYHDRKLYRLNDAVTNISCGIVEQLTGVFAKVFTVAAYYITYTHFALFELSDAWYWVVLCFVGVDFFYYWAHRMSHEVNLFWLGHVVHHQSEDYNLSVALRQSVFQKMFTFYFYLPLALLGFKPEWFVLVSAINLLYQFWIHTEVVGKLPSWFEAVLNTPSHHRVHHGRNPKYIDRNHAGTLIIWDKLFGTFQEEEERPVYGITTPTNTWNPVMANVQPFVLLWHELKGVPGFSNKLRLIFAPPGWYPASMGGFKKAPEVEVSNYRKFDVKLSAGLNFYLFAQYVLMLAITSFFLFNLDSITGWWRVATASWIICSVGMLGMLFENKRQALWLEVIRFVCAAVLLGGFVVGGMVQLLWLLIWAVIALASLVVLYRVHMHRVALAT